MKRFLKTKKGVATIATILVVAVSAVGAYAYFSSTGTGAGSVGTSSTIGLSSPLVGPLYPGAAATPVTVTINNPGTGQEFVNVISGTVTTQGGCLGSWFTVAPISYGQEVAGGTSPTADTTVALNDSGTNQDACQGKTMAIVWSSN